MRETRMTMSRFLPLARAAAVAVVLGSATLMPPAGVRASSSGSQVDLATTDARFGVDEAYQQADRADALGARWSRIPFIWDYIQHDGPGSWNSFALGNQGTDGVINGELARGRSVVGLLIGTPAWARQNTAWGRA